MKVQKTALLIMLPLLLLASCSQGGAATTPGDYKITDVRIYEGTPAWKLAQAVNKQDARKIASIAEKSPELLNYQDPKFGATLLYWAVGMEKYEAVEAMLKAGANPDVIATAHGGTALYLAAGYSFIDTQAKKDPKYVKLLLEYGADPDIGYIDPPGRETEWNGIPIYNVNENGTTPLMRSISCGIEKTKALVEWGADINAQTETAHKTAAIEALSWGGLNMSSEVREYAYYLIVVMKADVTQPYYSRRDDGYGNEYSNEPFYPVNLLRGWVVKLNTQEYEWKMAIVEEFARQGVDYWSTEIPPFTFDQIQKLYPDTWEEYILVY